MIAVTYTRFPVAETIEKTVEQGEKRAFAQGRTGPSHVEVDPKGERVPEGSFQIQSTLLGTLTVHPRPQKVSALHQLLEEGKGILDREVIQTLLKTRDTPRVESTTEPLEKPEPPPQASTGQEKPGWSLRVQRPFDRTTAENLRPKDPYRDPQHRPNPHDPRTL